MTANQLAYQNLQENNRHNVTLEGLKSRELSQNLGLGIANAVSGLMKTFNPIKWLK